MRMVTGLEETTGGAISIGLPDVAPMFQASTLDPALCDYVQDRLSASIATSAQAEGAFYANINTFDEVACCVF